MLALKRAHPNVIPMYKVGDKSSMVAKKSKYKASADGVSQIEEILQGSSLLSRKSPLLQQGKRP